MAFQNIYTHRKVAETSSKACEICYKPSSSVLVAPENKDFFYACAAHLKDKGFCSPIIDEATTTAKKKRAMEEEVARVKGEFEEKQKKKKEKEKEKEKKGEDKQEGSKKNEEEKKTSEGKNKDNSPAPTVEEEPRVFALQRAFYQQRLDKKRNAEIARRNRERFQNPSLFPSVPRGLP